MTFLFDRVTLIGLGLIGSSIARALKAKRLARHVVGADSSAAVRDRVRDLGIVDTVADNVAESVRDADCVILCVPVGGNASVAALIGPNLRPGAIVSDVGSVKSAVVRDVAPFLPEGVHFVPGHPVAGTEFSGPDAGFATLFENRWTILTPPEWQDESAVDTMRRLWEGMGALVEIMGHQRHDLVLAITSHVPHLIAYNLVGTAYDLETVVENEVIKFSAGGFRDSTRLAASDPTMWRDVFLNNKEAVLEMVARFQEDLAALSRMIRWGDGEGLFDLFTKTREVRRSIIASGQDTAAADFGRSKDHKAD